MTAQKSGLESFDPGERARAGQELARTDLAGNAKTLLAHVENEFDDRVVSAIAHAVVASPPERRDPKRVAKLREWARSELERLELEDRFMGHEVRPIEHETEVGPTYISWRPPS
jgi:hypothetical protein